MQFQTKSAGAHPEMTDATVLEKIVGIVHAHEGKIDGETGAGLEIAAIGGIEMDTELGIGRGVRAESVAPTDEVSSSGSDNSSLKKAMSKQQKLFKN